PRGRRGGRGSASVAASAPSSPMLTSLGKVSLRLSLRKGAATGATDRVMGPSGEDEPQEGIPPLPLEKYSETYGSSRRNDGTSRASGDTSNPSDAAAAAGTCRSTAGLSRRR